MRFLTYNIRYDNEADGIDRWDNRKRELAKEVVSISPAIFGLQEALHSQIVDLQNLMPSNYQWVGVGRNCNGFGEYNPIFYDSRVVTLQECGTYWLSDTPNEPGSTFHNMKISHPRIVTWAKCQNKETSQIFYFFCTHFGYDNEEERVKSAKLILELISNTAHLYPSILVGDLNTLENTEEYLIIATSYYKDARKVASKVVGNELHTFTGFRENHGKVVGISTIDFVFVSGFEVSLFEVPNNRTANNRCISDHRCIFIDATINV